MRSAEFPAPEPPDMGLSGQADLKALGVNLSAECLTPNPFGAG